jgi:hypothetical protein
VTLPYHFSIDEQVEKITFDINHGDAND